MADTNQSQQTPLFGVSAVSPQALALRRQLLLEQAKAGMDTSAIRSPWQGAARVAQAVMANLQLGMEERSESEARQRSKENLANAYKTGDLSAVLADPFISPEAMRGLLETKVPRPNDVGTGITYTDPLSAKPVSTLDKNNIGTMSTPSGSMPYVVPGAPYNRPQPPAPIPNAGGPAPRPAAPPSPSPSGMRPASFDERFSAASPAAMGGGAVIPDAFRKFATESNAIEQQRIAATTEAKGNADLLAEHRAIGLSAKQQMADLETLRDLGRRAGYGLSAEIKTLIGNKTGIDMGGLTENQAYQAFLQKYAPLLRPEGSGGLKTAELAGFTNSLGGLSTTKEGRELAVANMAKIGNYKIRAGEIAAGPGTDQQKLDAIRGLEIPAIDFGRIHDLTQQRQAPGNWGDVSHGGRQYFKDPSTGSWFMR